VCAASSWILCAATRRAATAAGADDDHTGMATILHTSTISTLP
jgi:hypothetical protein